MLRFLNQVKEMRSQTNLYTSSFKLLKNRRLKSKELYQINKKLKTLTMKSKNSYKQCAEDMEEEYKNLKVRLLTAEIVFEQIQLNIRRNHSGGKRQRRFKPCAKQSK